jgi:hypothetical protein
MQKIIERFVMTSLKGDLHQKAIDCYKELRQACVNEDEADSFNRFANKVKNMYRNGPNEAFFELLKQQKLTLITKAESFSSKLDQQDAIDYFGEQQIMIGGA